MLAAACSPASEAGPSEQGTTATEQAAQADGAADEDVDHAAEGFEALGGPLRIEHAADFQTLRRAIEGEFAGERVQIAGTWGGNRAEQVQEMLGYLETATGMEVIYEGLPDHEKTIARLAAIDQLPDVVQFFQPAVMRELAQGGHLEPLDGWFPVDRVQADLAEGLASRGRYDGLTYAIWTELVVKSFVLYRPEKFEAAGFTPPTTWAELIELGDEIIADGLGNPWCVGTASGPSSGWVTSDWLENILLRSSPPEIYEQWINHEIPFDHPAIVEAANLLADLWFQEGAVFGGGEAIATIDAVPSAFPLTAADSRCWMHLQGLWITEALPPADDGSFFTIGSGLEIFALPSMNKGEAPPLLTSGALFSVTTDRPAARAVLEYLASAHFGYRSIHARDTLFALQSIPPEWYPESYQSVAAAYHGSVIRHDASDQMPAEIGTNVLWKSLDDWVRRSGQGTEEMLADVEAAWLDLEEREENEENEENGG